MMQKEPIGMQHQAQLTHQMWTLGLDISNYTFANAYVFRKLERGIHSVLHDKDSYLLGRTRAGEEFLQPMTLPQSINWDCLRAAAAGVDFIFPIPGEWVPRYAAEGFRCEFERSDSDYLVATQKLAGYPGRRLQAKRNLLQQFRGQYEFEVRDLGDQDLGMAQDLIRRWQSRAVGGEEETDFIAALEALENLEALGLRGRITEVGGLAASVIIGEPLNRETFVIHFAKADVTYKGVYQHAFQDLAANLNARFINVNLCEDIGLPNLRKSKLSYQPDLIRHKYRAFLKN